MNAIIIDDEISCVGSLQAKIEMFVPQVKILKTYLLPQEALAEIHRLDVDVVFLDIEMPQLNGITFAQKANLQNTEIIYTTAYQKYAVDALRVSAFDFLLKPVDHLALVRSIERLQEKKKEKNYKNISQLHSRYNKISVPSVKGMMFVALQNILWFESDNSYTTIHLLDGLPIVTSRSIGDFEEMLTDFDFCRIHNSTLINLQHIQAYVRGEGGSIILSNGTELEVSRRRKNELLQRIS